MEKYNLKLNKGIISFDSNPETKYDIFFDEYPSNMFTDTKKQSFEFECKELLDEIIGKHDSIRFEHKNPESCYINRVIMQDCKFKFEGYNMDKNIYIIKYKKATIIAGFEKNLTELKEDSNEGEKLLNAIKKNSLTYKKEEVVAFANYIIVNKLQEIKRNINDKINNFQKEITNELTSISNKNLKITEDDLNNYLNRNNYPIYSCSGSTSNDISVTFRMDNWNDINLNTITDINHPNNQCVTETKGNCCKKSCKKVNDPWKDAVERTANKLILAFDFDVTQTVKMIKDIILSAQDEPDIKFWEDVISEIEGK